jgi:hypothetical protein
MLPLPDQGLEAPFWYWNLLPIRRSICFCHPAGALSQVGLGVGLFHVGTLAGRLGLYQQGTSRHEIPTTPHLFSASCRTRSWHRQQRGQ